MKAFYRIKIIDGIEYAYEITPIYDPETKKIRQKSRYIGKEKDGKIVKVREKKVKDVSSYGELLPIDQVKKHYKLDKFLSREPDKTLKKANMSKDYGFEKMMLQLEKIKAVVMDNGQVFYSEITKKQRELLEVFHAVPKE